jgi:hypothetical protein
MNLSDENLEGQGGSTPAPPIYIDRATFSWAFVFALVILLALESKAIILFRRHIVAASAGGSLGLFIPLAMPPLVAVFAIGAYRNVKRIVSAVSQDAAIMRTIAFYGLTLLGFAFLTMELMS